MLQAMGAAGVWPVDRECLPTGADSHRVAEAVDTAVAVLWALTGRRFGLRPVEARPCPVSPANRCGVLTPGPGWGRFLDSGVARGMPTCESVRCHYTGAVVLPGPVHELLGFVVDGVEVALDSLVREGDRVWRRGGLPWPDQRLDLPSGVEGTWSIRYMRGVPVPAGGAHVVGVLAAEFYAVCTGGRCRLPRRVQQVQRQGVTVTMVDPSDIYATGATGLPEVDVWVRAMNPNRLMEPSVVWAPESAVW